MISLLLMLVLLLVLVLVLVLVVLQLYDVVDELLTVEALHQQLHYF